MEYQTPEFDRGAKQAASDIALGYPKLYWMAWGAWGEALAHELTERFGVTLEEQLSCIASLSDASFRAGYNRTITEYIEQTFGAGSIEAMLTHLNRFGDIRSK